MREWVSSRHTSHWAQSEMGEPAADLPQVLTTFGRNRDTPVAGDRRWSYAVGVSLRSGIGRDVLRWYWS